MEAFAIPDARDRLHDAVKGLVETQVATILERGRQEGVAEGTKIGEAAGRKAGYEVGRRAGYLKAKAIFRLT